MLNLSKVSEESPEEFLTRILKRLNEMTSKGIKFHVDTIEGELPPEELEKMRRMLEEN